MSDNQELTLEKMRKARVTAESVYMQFANHRKYYKSHAFCFYEREDGKYYNPRIERIFKNVIFYRARNKREVLDLLDRITRSGLYNNVCVMFFVNKYYDASMEEQIEELYETPCYSIENLYIYPECFGRLLQSEFGLNTYDDEFKRCVRDFKSRAAEFINQILEFNALVYLNRKKGHNFHFDKIKTSQMVKIEVDKITKSEKYDESINYIKEKLKIGDKEIENIKQELIELGDSMQNFRGKNLLDFFVEFIKDLKRLNDTGEYFTVKRSNVHINITKNRLSELSQFAITPSDLENFLDKRKENFPALSVNRNQ